MSWSIVELSVINRFLTVGHLDDIVFVLHKASVVDSK